MPEGPEHYKTSVFINRVSHGRYFSGTIKKSTVSKHSDIDFNVEKYTIYAKSRGKELMLILTEVIDDSVPVSNGNVINGCVVKGEATSIKNEKPVNENCLNLENAIDAKNSTRQVDAVKEEVNSDISVKNQCSILFQFGMSGQFQFTREDEQHKHAHLMFYTCDSPRHVLSFVDVRRFGKWKLSDKWSKDRGPDPVWEYEEFRKNVLNNIGKSLFSKPICEVLHDQRYFNGIGNYLRAEILHRKKIPPFDIARNLLEKLKSQVGTPLKKKKIKELDLLDMCNIVPHEVMMLEEADYFGGKDYNYSIFEEWLQCYQQPDMVNMIDHDGRTIWFEGPPGELAPTGKKAEGRHARTKKKVENQKENDKKSTSATKPRKRKAVETENAVSKYFKENGEKSMPIKKGRKRNVNETDDFVKKPKKSNMKEKKQATRNKKDTKESVKSKSVRNAKEVVDKKQNAKLPKIVSKKTNVRRKVSKNPARKK